MDHTQANGNTGIADSQAANADARDRLMDELNTVIDEAESWLKQVDAQENGGNGGGEAGSDVRAHFDETLRTAKSDLRKLEDSVIAGGRSAVETANVYVRDNPWKAVGLGAALGVIAGILVSRK